MLHAILVDAVSLARSRLRALALLALLALCSPLPQPLSPASPLPLLCSARLHCRPPPLPPSPGRLSPSATLRYAVGVCPASLAASAWRERGSTSRRGELGRLSDEGEEGQPREEAPDEREASSSADDPS